METTPQLISIKEACRQLGIGRTTFYELRKSGALVGECKIRRRTLMKQSAITAFIEHHETDTPSQPTDPAQDTASTQEGGLS